MPAAKIDDRPWLLDSERILVELGFREVEAGDRRALQVVFGGGALHRIDPAWRFWHRFSYVRGGHPVLARRLWNQFWRAFSIFYFFGLISIVRRRLPRPTTEQRIAAFSLWQDRLAEDADFLGGDAPDTVDLQLFGLVQMCASIPGESLVVLQEDPKLERLRQWVSAMQSRFGDYSHLYTASQFEPKLAEMEPAPVLERVFYRSGAALMWVAFPVMLPTALYFARRVRKKRLVR